MNTQPLSETLSSVLGMPLSLDRLVEVAGEEISWLWEGYLARRNVTLLTSQWKAGKTTLAANVLHRLKAGGQLAGLRVAPGKALVLTEEDPSLWYERSKQFDFREHVHWFCRPFLGRPSREQWLALVDHLIEVRRQVPFDLLVIDPLALFLPGRDENNAFVMTDFLASLQALRAADVAILVLHHPRKGAAADGQAARGSGALSGGVDILVEMHWFGHAADGDRRRKLLAWARFRRVPYQLVIEMNEAGTDYTALGTLEDVHTAQLRTALHRVLATANDRLTRRDILDLWPPDEPKPHPGVLWRWLDQAVTQGLLRCSGEGTKSDPLRYWTAEREQVWRQDPLRDLQFQEEENLRELYRELNELEKFPR